MPEGEGTGYGFKIKNKIFHKTKGENVMKKMNNKGFSLVELIVVVLIMAIIAVALAPQVMRWVENSRKSNDIEAYGSLVNALQVAGTDEGVLAELPAAGLSVTFTASGVSGITGTKTIAAVCRTLPELDNGAGGINTTAMKVQGDWSSVSDTDEAVLKNTFSSTTTSVTVTFDATNGVGGITDTNLAKAVIRTLPELEGSTAGTIDGSKMKVQGDWASSGLMNSSSQFVITVKKSADGSGLSVVQTNKPEKVFS